MLGCLIRNLVSIFLVKVATFLVKVATSGGGETDPQKGSEDSDSDDEDGEQQACRCDEFGRMCGVVRGALVIFSLTECGAAWRGCRGRQGVDRR